MFRPLATANFFARRGWRVTVVTAPESFTRNVTHSVDESLLEAIDPRVTVLRVPMPHQHLVTDVRTMSWARGNLPRLYQLRSAALRRLFPDRYATWIAPVVAGALATHVRTPVDVVLATGNPWSAFAAAWAFHRLTGVPYLLDYRDSWTLNQFTEHESFAVDSDEGRWESRLIAEAARVVFVNQPMLDWHARRHPDARDRMIVVQNGFDPEMLPEPKVDPPGDRPLRFGYVGTITAQLPHRATWRGWALATAEPELEGATAHLYGHLGFFAAGQDAIRRLLPDRPDVVWEGPVEKARIGAAYASLDVLLLMIPSSRFVTAGKTYESMAQGKPIVAIHTPQTAASGPMRGYPLAFPVAELEPEAVRDALVAAARAARRLTSAEVGAALEHTAGYRREVQLAGLEDALVEVLDGR